MKKMLAVAVVATAIPMIGWGWGPSKEEKEGAAETCKVFIAEQMNAITSEGENGPKVFDIYTKKGKIVVEVGYKIAAYGVSDKAHSVRLCIVDKEKGTISSPSPMNDSEWKK